MPEDVISAILMHRKDLSREMVLDLIEKKKAESGGFLSNQGAAMLVAQDLDVEVERGRPAGIRIRDVVSGLSDVTVIGRVTSISSLQEFDRKDGSLGKALRLVLADSTGELKCVAWDQQAERLANQQLQDRTISVSHGYTREGLGGSIELFVGDRGEVQIVQDVSEVSGHTTDEFTSIADALKCEEEVDLVGIVKTPPRIFEFNRAGGFGRVLRTKLMDKTGRITLVAWNERADDLRRLSVGKAVRISGGRIKTSINGSAEIHADSMSRVELLESAPDQLANVELQPLKISQIRANMRDIDVLARILKVQPPAEVKRTTGETTRVMRLLLGDDTGIIQASLWDDKAALDLKAGETVLIEDASSRERLGEVSISVGKAGAITMRQEPKLKSAQPTPKRIAELPHGGGPVVVEGTIINQPSLRQVRTSKGEAVGLSEIELRDDSGECRVVFWRDLARQAAIMRKGAKVRLFGVYPRLGFKGGVELSSGPMTYLETVGKPTPQKVDRIIELKEGVERVVQGIILELSSTSHASLACGRCGSKIELQDDTTVCERCQSTQGMDLSATLFLRVDDGSGHVDIEVESPESNALLAQDAKWIIKSLIERKASKIQLTVETLSRLIGMRIRVRGVLAKDLNTGRSVFRVKELQEIPSGREPLTLSKGML